MHCHIRLATLAGLLVVFLVAATTARTQAPQNEKGPAIKACAHGGYELWDGLKVLPVQFIEFDRNTATWKYQDGHLMKVGSFALAERTQYRSREKKEVNVHYLMARKDAFWLCYYCAH